MLTYANAHSKFILLPNNLRLAQRAPVGEWLQSVVVLFQQLRLTDKKLGSVAIYNNLEKFPGNDGE